MNLFHRGHSHSRSEAVEALFVENLTAHERAGQAAAAVARTADQNRYRLQRLRQEIAERTDNERHTRPQPPTSQVRSLVETALTRVQPHAEKKG